MYSGSENWIEGYKTCKDIVDKFSLTSAPPKGPKYFVKFHLQFGGTESFKNESKAMKSVQKGWSVLIWKEESECGTKHKLLWKIRNRARHFTTFIIDDKRKTLVLYCLSFLTEEICCDRTGVLKESEANTYVFLLDIGNHENRNLLIKASMESNFEVTELLISEHNFRMDYVDNKNLNAIEYAFDNYSKEVDPNIIDNSNKIIILLINNNSKLPKNMRNHNAPSDVIEIINQFINMRFYIRSNNIPSLGLIIQNNPNQRHFYDWSGQSILQFALIHFDMKVVRLLQSKNIILGPHERSVQSYSKYVEKLSLNRSTVDHLKVHSFEIMNMFRYKFTNNNKDKINKILSFFLEKLKMLEGDPIRTTLLRIVAIIKNLKIFINFAQVPLHYFKKRSFKGITIHLPGDRTESEICNLLLAEICEFVSTVTCLESFDRFGAGSKNSTIFKYYFNITHLERNEEILLANDVEIIESTIKESYDFLKKIQNHSLRVNFENFTPAVKRHLSNILGENVKFINELDNNDIYNIIIYDQITDHLKIKESRDKDSYFEIERLFVKTGTATGPQEINTYFDIMKKTKQTKLFCLIESFQRGKTKAFNVFYKKLREDFNDYFVSKINLSKCKVSLELLKIDWILEQILNIFQQCINPENCKHFSKIFKKLYKANKVIFLFDEVDSLNLTEIEKFALLLQILTQTQNQIYIFTQPEILNFLDKKFINCSYKFHQLSRDEIVKVLYAGLDTNSESDCDHLFTSINEKFNLISNDDRFAIESLRVIDMIVQIINSNEIHISLENIKIHELVEKIEAGITISHKNDHLVFEVGELKIESIYRIYSLIFCFASVNHGDLINNLGIIGKFKSNKNKWTFENIMKHGILRVRKDFANSEKYCIEFIDNILIALHVANYLYEFLFDSDYSISKEEFVRVFKIIRFVSMHSGIFKLIRTMLFSILQNNDRELCETMKKVITERIECIRNDICLTESNDLIIERLEFWTKIFIKNDDILCKLYNPKNSSLMFKNILIRLEESINQRIFQPIFNLNFNEKIIKNQSMQYSEFMDFLNSDSSRSPKNRNFKKLRKLSENVENDGNCSKIMKICDENG